MSEPSAVLHYGGTEIEFPLEGPDGEQVGAKSIPVYTTRPDTLFGVTFLAVDPSLEVARRLAARHGRAAALEEFVQKISVAQALLAANSENFELSAGRHGLG